MKAHFGVALLLLGGAYAPALAAPAPTVNPLAGTWELVAVENVLPDGTRSQPYGARPDGRLMIDSSGRYALSIFRAGRAPFASADKSRATPEEYRETVDGTNSHFGRCAVDAGRGVVTFTIEHASFPNWEGSEQVRTFQLEGNLLSYRVPVTTNATAAVGEVRWRRLP